jgi:hypothetical protein
VFDVGAVQRLEIEGVATARLVQASHPGRTHTGQQLRDSCPLQWRKLEPVHDTETRPLDSSWAQRTQWIQGGHRSVPEEQRHGCVGRTTGQTGDDVERTLIGPVQIVDREDHGLPLGQGTENLAQQAAHTACTQDRGVLAGQVS